jgi:hypothetical protein
MQKFGAHVAKYSFTPFLIANLAFHLKELSSPIFDIHFSTLKILLLFYF